MYNKKKKRFGKKKTSIAVKVGLPTLVIAVVGGSFFVNWNHFGRSPVAYYGMGAVPMMGMCPAKMDLIEGVDQTVHKPKIKPGLSDHTGSYKGSK